MARKPPWRRQLTTLDMSHDSLAVGRHLLGRRRLRGARRRPPSSVGQRPGLRVLNHKRFPPRLMLRRVQHIDLAGGLRGDRTLVTRHRARAKPRRLHIAPGGSSRLATSDGSAGKVAVRSLEIRPTTAPDCRPARDSRAPSRSKLALRGNEKGMKRDARSRKSMRISGNRR